MASKTDQKRPVIVRFAPSPTGFFHVGSARTALFNYLYAKKRAGKFILRIEDTDKDRSKKEYEEDIIGGMKWLGLDYDEIFRQSDRTEIHKNYLKRLIDSGAAYVSKEKVLKEGDREEVIRFKNPNRKIQFTDLIKGPIEFDTAELGDFVIAKSLDEPLFHLAVVADDFDMGITHIIRGEDHISNTPRQILIQEAIKAPRPEYAHLPLILAPDRSKLSKRKHGEHVAVSFYRREGYLPEALNNFLALIGWNPGNSREIFSMKELIENFEIGQIQKSGAIFNVQKLNWLNKEYLRGTKKELRIRNYEEILKDMKIPEYRAEVVEKIEPILTDKITHFGEIGRMAEEGEIQYFFASPSYKKEMLLWKDEKDSAKTVGRLVKIAEMIKNIPDDQFKAGNIKAMLWDFSSKEGRGGVLWPLRAALSGREKSPDPFTLCEVLGKEEVLKRVGVAISMLEK